MRERTTLRRLRRFFATVLALGLWAGEARPQGDPNERFKDVEIRVIRPKYFSKSGRFELGAQFNTVMNETFIYTFMASGLAAFHINETWAIEGFGSLGYSLDKEDKRVLFDEFGIRTKIFRTAYNLGGTLQYTPIYGKWQLSTGRLIYFDTYIAAGAGMTGLEWRYSDFCAAPSPSNSNPVPIPADQTKSYLTYIFGVGQRYFMTKSVSYKWDLRYSMINYNRLDAECDQQGSSVAGSASHSTITVQLGASKFF